MKLKTLIPLTLATLIVFPSAFAESTNEREMKELREQRDKAVADATKALDARYRQALEAVYRRALQSKDPAADAIKAELETLGPVGPTLGKDTTPPRSAGSLPRTMLGLWKVVRIGDWREKWEFKDDGTCEITKGTSKIPDKFCTWSKIKDTIEIRDENGDISVLEWPIRGKKLEGNDKSGGKIWLEKEK